MVVGAAEVLLVPGLLASSNLRLKAKGQKAKKANKRPVAF
jgi:hypothetical protein